MLLRNLRKVHIKSNEKDFKKHLINTEPHCSQKYLLFLGLRSDPTQENRQLLKKQKTIKKSYKNICVEKCV